jgi:hypothetical protein
MTFLVNKVSYTSLPDHTTKKVFLDVVLGASKILAATIPEVECGANVYANFYVISGGLVAEYENGKITLMK